MNKFEQYGLNPKLLQAIKEIGFENPTPIQEKTIPYLVSNDRDLIALAQTGTGKTAAFGLPLLQKTKPHEKKAQYLILCPTRELCLQIANEMEKFAKKLPEIKITSIYGGANIDSQIKSLKRGSQIIVATPGRMHDILRRRKADLSSIRTVVLDEADEMLNMGFKEDLNAILGETPEDKTTLLFSATMSKEIADIAMDYMIDPIEFTVGKKNTGSKNIDHVYYMASNKDKYAVLKRILDVNSEIYGIIFCRTRQDAKNTADQLMKDGYDVDALHGDLSHAQRETVMSKFRHKGLQVLVATDVAARGLDVTELTHIIHYNLPEELEVYTHRSGRTGRKGNKGVSVAIISPNEFSKIRKIEKIIDQSFSERKIPGAEEILENRVIALAHRLEKIEASEKVLSKAASSLLQNLSELSKDEIIEKFLALELKRFIDFYKNTPEIKTPDAKVKSGEGRPPRNRDRGGFRKGKGFSKKPGWGSDKGKSRSQGPKKPRNKGR